VRFPGPRIAKHYFPIERRVDRSEPRQLALPYNWYVVGLDQLLVDMEVEAPESFALELGIVPGESLQLCAPDISQLLHEIAERGYPCRFAAGGTVGNTLHNYTQLAGEPAILLGTLPEVLRPGEPAFHYVAQTPPLVDLSYLQPRAGAMGTAITLIFPDGERSFAVDAGVSNDFAAADVPRQAVRSASAVLTTLYTLAEPRWPVAGATIRLFELAREAKVPVAFGLGTAGLIRRLRPQVEEWLADYVTIAAMNDREAHALSGLDDPLLACEAILEWVDLVLITQGPRGLTLGGYVDERHRRQTRQPLRHGAIPEYNRWEYSRLMRRSDCARPIKTFTHIHPYRGGPRQLINCNGAGDAALAAVLHDVAANRYHRARVPDSDKHRHGVPFLTYSSLSRNAQYGNRVAYEVLRCASPRLSGPVGADRAPSS
jgi:inosine kinase